MRIANLEYQGDELELEIERIGVLRNRAVAA